MWWELLVMCIGEPCMCIDLFSAQNKPITHSRFKECVWEEDYVGMLTLPNLGYSAKQKFAYIIIILQSRMIQNGTK